MRATADGAVIFNDLIAELGDSFTGNENEAQAQSIIRQWADTKVDSSQELHGLTWATNAMTNMAGQIFVRDIELGDKVRKLEATGETAGTFLNFAFTEAIDHFESRSILPPEEFDALIDAERSRAFTLRRAIADGVQRNAFTRLGMAMAPGGPGLGAFIEALSPDVEGGGYPGGVRNYLETVYRTTTATSYNAGRFRQQTDPDVLALGDIWLTYRTAGDSRVRAEHSLLEGMSWKVGDPEAEAVYPPNAFNCRCVMTASETPPDAETLQRTADFTADDSNIATTVHEGFRGAPGAHIEQESQ